MGVGSRHRPRLDWKPAAASADRPRMSLALQSFLPFPNSCQGTSPHQQGRGTKMTEHCYCGIDVAKDRLDAQVLPHRQRFSVDNNATGGRVGRATACFADRRSRDRAERRLRARHYPNSAIVGSGKKRGWYCEAKRLSAFQVDGQLEFDWLLHRQISGFSTLQNLVHILGSTSIQIGKTWAIRDEPAGNRIFFYDEHSR